MAWPAQSGPVYVLLYSADAGSACSSLAYTTGFMLGPVLAGLMIRQGHATALLAGLIAACCLAAVLALGLARWLPASANRAQEAGAVAELAGMTGGP